MNVKLGTPHSLGRRQKPIDFHDRRSKVKVKVTGAIFRISTTFYSNHWLNFIKTYSLWVSSDLIRF